MEPLAAPFPVGEERDEVTARHWRRAPRPKARLRTSPTGIAMRASSTRAAYVVDRLACPGLSQKFQPKRFNQKG